MSKRQAVLLLSVFMANLWGSVLYAPAVGARRSVPQLLSDSGREDDLGSMGRQGAMYGAADFQGGADQAAFKWVQNEAQAVARYLYNEGVVVVRYDDIVNAYQQLRGENLNKLDFIEDNTKLFIQGAVQAFVDSMTSRIAADQRGVDAWLHQHAQNIVEYFKNKKVTSIDNYAAVLRACNDLQITPLAAKKEKVKQRIVDALNNLLDDDYTLLPSDEIHFYAILSKLRADGAHNVNKRQMLRAARDLKLAKDVIARIDAMPEQHMQKLLQELNKELDEVHDPKLVSRALNVITQVGIQEQGNVAAALDVIHKASQGKEDTREENVNERYVRNALDVMGSVANNESVR